MVTLLAHDGLELGGGDVLAPGILVGQGFNGLFAVLVGHGSSLFIQGMVRESGALIFYKIWINGDKPEVSGAPPHCTPSAG
jgi:hypothetical protein